eukprot:tig00000865_g5100.t1
MPARGVTVEARFERTAFFPGEQLRTRIFVSFDPSQAQRRPSSGQLSSPADTAHTLSQLVIPDDDDAFDLEWLAVQLHGQAFVNPALVSLPANPEPPKSEKTVDADGRVRPPNFAQADETGRCIFVTRPAVLLQNVHIPVGSKRELSYTATLPSSLPPSYRGTAVRYSYFLAVGIQERGQPHRVLKVPFRLLVNAGGSCLLSVFPGYPELEECGVKVKEMLSGKQALESARVEDVAPSSSEGPGGDGVDAASLARLRQLRRMETADRDEHGSPRYEVPVGAVDRPGGPWAEEEESEEEGAGEREEAREGEEPFSVDPDFAVLAGGAPAALAASFGALDSADWDAAIADGAPGPPSFNIRHGEASMARFALGREAFRVGDAVSGVLDFSLGSAPCTALRVLLECEESVAPGMVAPAPKGKPAPPASSARTLGEIQELTLASLLTSFSFYVPHDAPACFSSDIVSVKYTLLLEFVVPGPKPADKRRPAGAAGAGAGAGEGERPAWPAACEEPVEVLQWRTPVTLLNARIPTSAGPPLSLALAL